MLEVKGLTRFFGGLAAIYDFDLNITRGEMVGLIGPNGAGKTTIFNLLSGFLRPSRGKILFEGKDIIGQRPHSIAEKGLIRTFQATTLFTDFTALENIMVACYLNPKISFWEAVLHTSSSRQKEECMLKQALQIARFVGLNDMANVPVPRLPHGYKRILGIAMALAAEPKLLLLDEPLAGMNTEEVAEVSSVINRIWQRGTTVLLIEHNMRATMSLCKRIVVLNFGRKIAEGSPEEIRQNEEVIQAYLGGAKNAA